MRIANPIYDVFFKYMIADIKIAKYIIEKLLERKVLKIQPLQQEKVVHTATELTIIRYDYSCTIQLSNGEEKNIIIELQKSEKKLDIGRFRNYLAKNYKESNVLADGSVDYLPIIAIYFLGFNINHPQAFIKAECKLIDLETQEFIQTAKDNFIQKLSHELYVVQIQKINENSEQKLNKVFGMFNQKYKVEPKEQTYKYNEAILEIPEENILDENQEIYEYLHHMLERQEVMEDYEEAKRLDIILAQNEENKFIEGKIEGKIEIAKNLKKMGLSMGQIMQATNLSLTEIENLD